MVSTPLTVLGGAGSLEHFRNLFARYGIIGAAAGSFFVFKGRYHAVLINYPNRDEKTLSLIKVFALKQIIQNLKTGKVEVANLPMPSVNNGKLFIKTRRTLISAGTERMLVEFGKAGWIEKARMHQKRCAWS